MKTNGTPNQVPAPPRHWRSMAELAGAPEQQAWAQQEFPHGGGETPADVSRRDFLQLMGASFGLAGLGLLGTGCRRPEAHIVPFGKQPENYVHGVAEHYATAMPTRTGAVPLVVKSHEGRPIKIEGNPTHPDSRGASGLYAQASILDLYDPDRARVFRQDKQAKSRAVALAALDALGETVRENDGQGVALLLESSSSPSRERLLGSLKAELPQADICIYEPVDVDIDRRVASEAFGASVRPRYHLDKARRILSLDCDFLGTEEDSLRATYGFATGRKRLNKDMARLYTVEPLMTQTGANADHRLRLPASAVADFAKNLLAEIEESGGGGGDEWIAECAKDLKSGGGVVLAGQRQPEAVHVLAHAINVVLKALGTIVELMPAPESQGTVSISELAEKLKAGEVDTLFIIGGNPAYNAPANAGWSEAQGKAKKVVRLGYYEDETFDAGCTWHLPMAHYLESWGDVRTGDGTWTPVQPLIRPLFEGLSELEVLARLSGGETDANKIVRTTHGGSEEAWKRALHDGFQKDTAAKPLAAELQDGVVDDAKEQVSDAPNLTAKNLEVVFAQDNSVGDGRWANNGWLQELPDPITKITWDNAIFVSRVTAVELRLKNGQMWEVDLNGRKVQGPVWIQPGQADNVLGLPLGYGRRTGRIANFRYRKTDTRGVGFDAYPLRTSDAANFATGAKFGLVAGRRELACTQDHWSMEGRAIIREANLDHYAGHKDFAIHMGMDSPSHKAHMPKVDDAIYEHPYKAKPTLKSDVHQWAMVVDLNSCTGCNACVVACQSENNIPIVGRDQVERGREMHWLRIDRYYTGAGHHPKENSTAADEAQHLEEWIDNPQVANQPMACQHCESAPCESVCPVNATVHDEEGLNVMVYNRCVGTRYCSNNCAWKVRRFNYFDYNKRPLQDLYQGPLASKKDDEYDLIALAKNPDVSVRMRGVMEKCTYCVQRIEQAKIATKVAARDSDDVTVAEGAVQTACQQSCPAECIEFGNLLDKDSRVSQARADSRNYEVLGFLDNKPRTTYLAKVRNPNPAMPDAPAEPYSTQEQPSHGHGHDDHGHGNGEPKKGDD